MLNVGAPEFIFIVIAALLILGPRRLPELARGIGKFLREFRRQTDEVRATVEREFYRMDQDLNAEPKSALPEPKGLPEPPDLQEPEVPASASASGDPAPLTTEPAPKASLDPERSEEQPLKLEPVPGTVARGTWPKASGEG